jgi:hypothetical protein
MEKGIMDIIKDAKGHITKDMDSLRAKYRDSDKFDEVKAVIEEAMSE